MSESKSTVDEKSNDSKSNIPKFISPIAKARAAAKAKKEEIDPQDSLEDKISNLQIKAEDTSLKSIFKAEDSVKDARPSILILGGCGMIGRNFVKFLTENHLASKIRVADKTIPAIAFMHPKIAEIFDSIDFVQADLTKPAHIERAFANHSFDYVVNLAAETRYGQSPQVYEERCSLLSKVCAQKAAECKVKKFIEISTAQVYKSQNRKPSDEAAGIGPWTKMASAKLNAENEVRNTKGLYSLILRPSYVYGPADISTIMPRVVCAAAYVQLNEKMKFLWDASMKINTVHVYDVCNAIWHLLSLPDSASPPSGTIYNICDKSDTDQGKINKLLEDIFHIRTGFHGSIISNVARLRLDDVVETANEKHMRPWTDLCKKAAIESTPLSPFMSSELLDHHHLFIDGSKIEKDTGFGYKYPVITQTLLQDSVAYAIEAGIFPNVLN